MPADSATLHRVGDVDAFLIGLFEWTRAGAYSERSFPLVTQPGPSPLPGSHTDWSIASCMA